MLNDNQARMLNSVLKIIGFPKDHKTSQEIRNVGWNFQMSRFQSISKSTVSRVQTKVQFHVTTIFSDLQLYLAWRNLKPQLEQLFTSSRSLCSDREDSATAR